MKVGDLVSITHFTKVVSVKPATSNREQSVGVKSVDDNQCFDVIGTELIQGMKSADSFTKEEKVSRTECAQTLLESFNVPFTVVFDKADGTERKLRGRLLKSEPLMGRSQVEDLDETSANRLRLVDHRTIKSLVVNNVKYSVKDK